MSKKKKQKHTTHKSSAQQAMKGVLEVTRSGIGYVVLGESVGDILVRPGDFNTALNGDTVRVKVIKENSITKKKRRTNYRSTAKKTNRIYRSYSTINKFCILYSDL